ncbi:MAG: HAMP domain-containing histidine kinase [Planctomycetes bacterium]|nr:HAMP domain-containing histidine kinase [Planctomycetota bacterium]
MRLQHVFAGTVLGLVTVALVAAGALALLTASLHKLVEDLGTHTEAIRAADEVETQLLLHNRLATRELVTGEPELRRLRAASQLAVWRELEEVEAFVGSPEEQALLASARARLARYFQAWDEVDRAADPLEAYRRKGPHLEEAQAELHALAELNVVEARQAQREARRRDEAADALATAAVLVLLLGAGAATLLLRRQALRPILRVDAAIRRYGAGDRDARAPEEGASEVREIARTFNEMAAALGRRREEQLAFLGGVAHDLRNPLTPLKLAASAAGADVTPERARRTLGLVGRQVERLERMIGDLLETARIEAGHLELRAADHDAGALLDDVARLHAAAGTHELVASGPTGPLPVRCDALRVEQVLNNLVSNAMKYSPPGSRVELSLGREGDEAVFAVRDHGVGIPPEELGRIFEPFRRGARVRGAAIPGVGLGLCVARRIVEAHGGRIEVESARGLGSTFRVRLPLAAAHRPAPALVG